MLETLAKQAKTYKSDNYQFTVLPFNFTTNGRKGRQGSIQKFTVPVTARYLIKAWVLGEEHIPLIMEVIVEPTTVERVRSRRGYSH